MKANRFTVGIILVLVVAFLLSAAVAFTSSTNGQAGASTIKTSANNISVFPTGSTTVLPSPSPNQKGIPEDQAVRAANPNFGKQDNSHKNNIGAKKLYDLKISK